jgi:hypothetical protein
MSGVLLFGLFLVMTETVHCGERIGINLGLGNPEANSIYQLDVPPLTLSATAKLPFIEIPGRVESELSLGTWGMKEHMDPAVYSECRFGGKHPSPLSHAGWLGSYEALRIYLAPVNEGRPHPIHLGVGVGYHQVWEVKKNSDNGKADHFENMHDACRVHAFLRVNFLPTEQSAMFFELEDQVLVNDRSSYVGPTYMLWLKLGYRFTVR